MAGHEMITTQCVGAKECETSVTKALSLLFDRKSIYLSGSTTYPLIHFLLDRVQQFSVKTKFVMCVLVSPVPLPPG